MTRREFVQLAEQHGLQADLIHDKHVRLKLDRERILRVSLARSTGAGVYGTWGVPAFPHAKRGVLIPCVLHGTLDFTDPMDPIEALCSQLSAKIPAYSWTCKREWLFARYQLQSGRCSYCGQRISFKIATLDHMTPLTMYGQDEPGNWALSCATCNVDKGDLTVEEYRASRGVPSFPLLGL